MRLAAIAVVAAAAACTGSGTSPGATPAPSAAAPSPAPPRPVRFTDVTAAVGLALPPDTTWGSALVDADGNGWPDLLVNRHKRPASLYWNDEGRFARAAGEAVLNAPAPGRVIYDRHNCAWGEAGRDGEPDLYCGSGAQDGVGAGPNRLFTRDGDGFTDRAGELGVADELGRARSVNWLDHDSDGDLDLFVANEIRSGAPNRLFGNKPGAFVPEDSAAAAEVATRSSSWADWDADGDPDLLVLGHGFVGSRAYENEGGTFREVRLPFVTAEPWLSASWGELGRDPYPDLALVSETRLLVLRRTRRNATPEADVALRAGRVAQWLDVENDGDLDLFLVEGAAGDPPRPGAVNRPDSLWLNRGGTLGREPAPSLEGPAGGNGDSASVADFDRDGALDLYVTNGYLRSRGRSALLRNESAWGGSVAVTLRGPARNPLAFGATVTATSGGRRQWRQVTDGVAFTSQSESSRVHFGLGAAATAVVRVEWPGGTRDCLWLRSGDDVDLTIGGSPCPS